MFDGDAVLRVVIAALVGLVAGIVLTSFTLSAYGVAFYGLNWGDLNNIATFWNGHLGSIALLVLALSLYYQSRQFAAQTATERAQLARYRHELLRTSLNMLIARMAELGAALRAYVVNTQTTPLEVRTFMGLEQFLAVIQEDPSAGSDYIEVWIDTPPLNAYVSASEQVTGLCKELLELDPVADLSAVYGSHSDERLPAYAALRQARQANVLASMRNECNDEGALSGLAAMLKQGWEIESYQNARRIFLKARRFTAAYSRINILSADDCVDVETACRTLVQRWKQQYT